MARMRSVYAKARYLPRNLARGNDTNAHCFWLSPLFRTQLLAFAIAPEFEAVRSKPTVEGVAQDQHLETRRRIGQIECHVGFSVGHDKHRMPVDGLGEITAKRVGI